MYQNWEITVRNNYMMNSVDIYCSRLAANGLDKEFLESFDAQSEKIYSLKFNEYMNETGERPPTLLTIPMNYVPELVKGFSTLGIKPADEVEIKATLEAKEKHLEDIKEQLAFVNSIVKGVVVPENKVNK